MNSLGFMNHFQSISTQEWPEIWQAAYQILRESMLGNQLITWIDPLQFVKSETTQGGWKFQLSALNDFSANWVRDHYKNQIETALTQVVGSSCEVSFSTREENGGVPAVADTPREFDGANPSFEHAETAKNTVIRTEAPQQTHPSRYSRQAVPLLDSKYTFESFVVGPSNQFAHASAVSVAEAPGRHYNPLFIYSPPGLGKTHLLHAIGNYFLGRFPEGKIAYLSAETFMNELVEGLQRRKMTEFRQKYRNTYDLILIDDIQFIAGKDFCEEEFFHTFNALYSSKRQIAVTCDRPPKEINGLEERIRTRLEWGLIADIKPPEIETRIAIIKSKAEQEDIYLQDEVATFLATYIRSNVRELEGVLTRLQVQASLSGSEISLELAKAELKRFVPEEGPAYTVEMIQEVVCSEFKIKIQDLKSASRAKPYSLPRQIAMFLVRKYTGIPLKDIGNYFGGKDHTTVMHACEKIETQMEINSDLREKVESIQTKL